MQKSNKSKILKGGLNMKYLAGYIYMGSMAEGAMHRFKTFKEAENWIKNELKDVDDEISIDDWVSFGNECKIKLYTFDCHQYFIIKFQ